MDSKSVSDGASPSTSNSLLPHLRASRRGSLASFTTTTQLDKETLSQTLDQIHSTASQSETLTTFNEYTSPPSSSSGTDSKGIASELQGGLSGLYTIFRASVGNVKDIVNPGGENVGGPATSTRNLKGSVQSPAPSSKSTAGSHRVTNFSTAHVPYHEATTSERQSTVGLKSVDSFQNEKDGNAKPSKVSVGSATTSSKSLAGSTATLKSPPVTITQAPILTTISPALVEVNVSAIKQTDVSDPQLSNLTHNGLSLPQEVGQITSTSRPQANAAKGAVADNSGSILPEITTSKTSGNGNLRMHIEDTKGRWGNVNFASQDELPERRDGQESYSEGLEDNERPSSTMENRDNETEIASPSRGYEEHPGLVPVVTTNTSTPDDFFQSSSELHRKCTIDGPTDKVKYQHLELPIRKGLAPPLVTRSHSPNSSISRGSSSEVIHTESYEHTHSSQKKSTASQPAPAAHAYFRDPKTLDVFSQIKNKVLNKQYWMKDENAKDCFYCGDPFSTFRRKHHCSMFIY